MEDVNNEVEEREELKDEEEARTQRFSVVVMWSPESDERLSPSDLQVIIDDGLMDIDEDASVEVTEVIEPTY